MRVGIFAESYKPYMCGVNVSIEILTNELRKMGHEVYIITLDCHLTDDFIDDKNVIRFKGTKYPFKKLQDFYFTIGLKSKLKKLDGYNFDIIHSQTEFSIGTLGVMYAKKYNIPAVYTYHTNYEDYFHFVTNKAKPISHKVLLKALKQMIKRFNKRTNAFIAPTKKVEKILNSYGVTDNINVIPTGIDLEKFNTSKLDEAKLNELREKYNLINKKVVLSIGRVSDEKFIDEVIDAFSKSNYDNSVLLIVGSGPALDKLKNQVSKLNLEDKVIFTGRVDYEEITYYYALGSFFVNASNTETQGLTYVESLASGLPLIAKKDEVLEDILIHNKNGLFFETTEELTNHINLLVKDDNLLETLKNNSIESVNNYDKKAFGKNMEKLYKDLLSRNK